MGKGRAMAGADDWESSWDDDAGRLLHNAVGVPGPAWERYWNVRARGYAEKTAGSAGLREDIVRYLVRERVLRPEDYVLDVGCGPGTYTLHLAKASRSVVGLDVSGDMLAALSDTAASRHLENVWTIRSPWETFDDGLFDLVFSAFCPGVNSARSLLKMECSSRRSCCFVTSGSVGQPAIVYRIWERLTGKRCAMPSGDAFYSFNLLYTMGRSPNVRAFASGREAQQPETMISGFVEYFRMFMDVGLRETRIIEEAVRSADNEEKEDIKRHDCIYVLHWEIG